MLRNLSYRIKTPLSLSLVILLTAIVVSTVLIGQTYQDSRRTLTDNGIMLAGLLTHSLRPALTHDDIWQAFEILTAVFPVNQDQRVALLLLQNGQIYVSSHPKRFPIFTPLNATGVEYSSLQTYLQRHAKAPEIIDDAAANRIFILAPILTDDQAQLGTLVLSYARTQTMPQFWRDVKRVGIATLMVLLLLLPLGWLWGKRLSTPLAKLVDRMGKIGNLPPDRMVCDLTTGDDEIGQLSTRFKDMLNELREKQALEQQILISERLAALGRMSAGIAHEINNPLGGMLNAINTYQHHGKPDALTSKTISLLERGLTQIRETVGALLVEARPESRALTPLDVDDIHTLILADSQRKALQLIWRSKLNGPVPIPSTQVRQILLNLLLNAITATPHHGQITMTLIPNTDKLEISVCNTGIAISNEQMAHLFEPFQGGGNGLGLWVTYQIVQQLGGNIDVHSQPNESTCFNIILPLEMTP